MINARSAKITLFHHRDTESTELPLKKLCVLRVSVVFLLYLLLFLSYYLNYINTGNNILYYKSLRKFTSFLIAIER